MRETNSEKNEIFMKNTYFFIVYKLLVFMNFPVFVFKEYIVCTIILYHPNTCFICIPPTITAGISTNLYQTNKALSVFTYFQYKPPLQFYKAEQQSTTSIGASAPHGCG